MQLNSIKSSISLLILSLFFLIFVNGNLLLAQRIHAHKISFENTFACLPCGSSCDFKEYAQPGKCPDCNSTLVSKTSINYANIRPERLTDYIRRHPHLILLDVRSPDEFNGRSSDLGHLKNAINIPISEVKNRYQELVKYKNKTILVYCSHSHRSPQVAYFLGEKGFSRVINLEGGLSSLPDKTYVE